MSESEPALQNFRRVLTADLDDLVDTSRASIGLARIVNQWAMQSKDRAALVALGVPIEADPDGLQMQGSIQKSVDPEVSVAGGLRGYRLGSHWRRTLAAMTPSGEVWAICPPDDPRYSSDTATMGVNSSVAGFVDVAWRWHAIRPPLLRLGFDDAFFEAAELFLARLPEIDEALADEKRFPWWRSLILNW